MCMADGEDISALEIIELLIESYKKSGGKSKGNIFISFILDSCFAAGQYIHVRNALERGEIEGSECLDYIGIRAACNWNEISFGGEKGGRMS